MTKEKPIWSLSSRRSRILSQQKDGRPKTGGQNFGNGYPEGESVSVEHAESWSIPGAEAGYIYEVDAVFENGTVSYGFEVKK
mgnify:CR=1 FL=1